MGMALKLIINARNYSEKENESQGILPSKPFDYKRDILHKQTYFHWRRRSINTISKKNS